MHLFLCGITRHELYHLLELLVKNKLINWEDINQRITSLHLPAGKRIPKVQAASKTKKPGERHLDMTASEVLLFATFRYMKDSAAKPRRQAHGLVHRPFVCR